MDRLRPDGITKDYRLNVVPSQMHYMLNSTS